MTKVERIKQAVIDNDMAYLNTIGIADWAYYQVDLSRRTEEILTKLEKYTL